MLSLSLHHSHPVGSSTCLALCWTRRTSFTKDNAFKKELCRKSWIVLDDDPSRTLPFATELALGTAHRGAFGVVGRSKGNFRAASSQQVT